MLGLDDFELDRLGPRVSVEARADDLPEVAPAVAGVGCRVDRDDGERVRAQPLEQDRLLGRAPRGLADGEERERASRSEVAVVEVADVVDAPRPKSVELRNLRDTDGGLIEHAVHSGRPVLIGRHLSDEEQRVGHGRSRYGGPLVPSSRGGRRGGTMRVGFVGLGAMGLPMTRHLLAAGHEVTVASRSRPSDRRRGRSRGARRWQPARGRGRQRRHDPVRAELT